MRAFCHAAISASEKATRPGDTRIGLGKCPSLIMDWSVERDLTPAAARATGSFTKRSSNWSATASSGIEVDMPALRWMDNGGRYGTNLDHAGGTNAVGNARLFSLVRS